MCWPWETLVLYPSSHLFTCLYFWKYRFSIDHKNFLRLPKVGHHKHTHWSGFYRSALHFSGYNPESVYKMAMLDKNFAADSVGNKGWWYEVDRVRIYIIFRFCGELLLPNQNKLMIICSELCGYLIDGKCGCNCILMKHSYHLVINLCSVQYPRLDPKDLFSKDWAWWL